MADFGILQSQPNFFQTALLGLQAGQKIAAQNRLDAALQSVDIAKPETILPVLKLDPQTGLGLLKAHDTQVAADREAAGRTALSQYLLGRYSPAKGGDPASTPLTAPALSMPTPAGAVTAPSSESAAPAGTVPAMSVDTLRPLFMAQESSGDYSAVNKSTGALGAYQVMPDTARALSRRLGLAWQPGMMTGTSPAARDYQDKIGGAAIQGAINNSGGDPHTAFSYYYGGSDHSKWGPKTRRYAGEMMDRLGGARDQPQAGAPGLIRPGNIDLDNRPVVKNGDGTISTELSFSIGTPDGEVLLPRVVKGKVVSQDEAIANYRRTGENLGTFRTPEDADRFAEALHNRQGTRYGGQPATPSGQPLTMETAPVLPQLSEAASALIQADPELYLKTQASLAQIDETHLKAIGDAAEAQGAVAAAIKDQNIPYAQRRAFIQSQSAYLGQHGVTPEMIAGFDPTDQNVNAQLVEALGVKGWQEAKNREADNARADRADARAERADGRAAEARTEGRVRFQERDKDRAAVAAGNIPHNTDDLNY